MPRLFAVRWLAVVAWLGCAPPAVDPVGEPEPPPPGAGEEDAAPGSPGGSGGGGAGGAGGAPDAGADAPAADAGRADAAAPEEGTRDAADAPAADAAADVSPDAGADGAPDTGPPPPPTWNGGQVVVAVGNDGRRLWSRDGTAWTGDTRDAMGNSSNGVKVLRAAAYGGKALVAVGGGCAPDCVGRIMTFDGRTWTEVTPPPRTNRLMAVAHGNGMFVAVGALGQALRSTDHGRTWSAPARVGAEVTLRAIAFGNVGGTSMFVAVGDGYARVRSIDGVTWTDLYPPNGSTTDAFRGVSIGNGIAVVAGGTGMAGRRMRSVDGSTWTDDAAVDQDLNSLVFSDGRFMAFTGSGDARVYLSPDGKTWTAQATMSAGSQVAVGTLNGTRLFVSRVSPSTIRTSADGIAWTTRLMSITGDATLNAFVFAGH